MTTAIATATLARSIARALGDFAEAIESASGDVPIVNHEEVPDPATEHNLGKRQRQIVQVPGLAAEGGLRTSEIATHIDYEVPNTYSTLQALSRQGIVELVPDKEPQHWRLARRYRPTTEAFKNMARLVAAGEWTTYGDISIAVVGHPKAARGVGRAAALAPDFPTPHRVLMEGGRINPAWQDSEGRGPAECLRRLEAEGVRFDNDCADPSQRVTWDELHRRDASQAISDGTPGT